MVNQVNESLNRNTLSERPPWGFRWRSSYWFATYAVGLGIAVDVIVYSIIVPVVPFQLEHLGYTGISALSGWLLFSYSGGLLISTIPVAVWSEHYDARKLPMLAGLIALIASQILFMEASSFPVMCVARIIQGISSSVVWTVGLAFLCDVIPQEIIGRQIGIVMSGLSIGLVLGHPIGGLLYSRFGFRGPFVFTLIGAFIDLVSRLIIIEPKEARRWDINSTTEIRPESPKATPHPENGIVPPSSPEHEPQSEIGPVNNTGTIPFGPGQGAGVVGSKESVEKPLPLLQVMFKLSKSSRALVALVISFVYGFVYSSQEPAIPLHLQAIWGLTSQKVGIFLLTLSVPMLISSPITGWLTDKIGAEWVAAGSMILAIPWWGVITIKGSLALFGVSFALESFFTSGAISPLTAELAAVSRNIQGVGYAHVYAAFNVAFGIGTTIGPIVGGQMYDHLQKGWFAVSILGAAALFATVLLIVPYTGDRPLLTKIRNLFGI